MEVKKKKKPGDYNVLYCRAKEHIDEINQLIEKLLEIYPHVYPNEEYKKRRNDFIQEGLLVGLDTLHKKYVRELSRKKFKNKNVQAALTARFNLK